MTGTATSLAILFIEKVARKQRIKLLFILAALGLLILTGQQVIEHLESRNWALLEEARVNIVEDIRKKVPCLSLVVNANKHYEVSLLLAYLFTNSETRPYMGNIIWEAW